MIMAVGYGMAAVAIVVKALATVLLTNYWLFISHLLIVLASAIGDGVLAVALLLAYRAWRDESVPGGQ